MSTFFRTHKNPENPFVMVDKRPVENPSLSWAAKGMLSYLLSRPNDWEVIMADLINRSTDGEYAVRNIVKELMAAGHLERHDERDEHGKFVKTVYDVYESPISRFPASGFPTSGKTRTTNTDSTNTENTNNTASGENQPSAKPKSKVPAVEELGLDWQIASGRKVVTMPDEQDKLRKDAANLIAMGFGIHTQTAYEIAYTFMRIRGIIIPASKVKAQRKPLKEMIEMGVLPWHVEEATRLLMNNPKLTGITDLYSIVKTAIGVAYPAPDGDYTGPLEGV